MRQKSFRDRLVLKSTCAIIVASTVSLGDGAPCALGFNQSFAAEAMSTSPVVKTPISTRPVIDAPMSKPTMLTMANAEPTVSNDEAATVLARKGETAFASRQFLNAAMLFSQAAATTDASNGDHQRYLAYLHLEAEALFQQGNSFADNEALNKSIERLTSLLTLIDKTGEPRDWAATSSDLGMAMVVSGARFGDHPKIDSGIAAIRAALEIRTFESSPKDWADSQIDLAKAFVAGGRISENNAMLEEAIRICEIIIDKKSDAGIYDAQYLAKSVMSNALQQLGQHEHDATTILSATSVSQDALSAIKRDKQPIEWAQTMNYLANSNREMGGLQSDASLELLALDQYGQSLEVRTRDAYPVEWAQTQLDLGNAYLDLAYLQNDISMLERAMDAYLKSLKVRSETATPLEWGMSRNNYGTALAKLADIRPDSSVAARSSEVSAFRDALRVTTRERAPLGWAMMQLNLGQSLVSLWKRKQVDVPNGTGAAMDALMKNQILHPKVDGVKEHEAALAMIMKRAASVDELEEAIGAFEAAARVYTKDNHPQNWITTQNHIATTLHAIGSKLGQPHKFEEAIVIYRKLEGYLQLRYDPAAWAYLQNDIGVATQQVGRLTHDAAKLRESAIFYRESILAMPDDQPFGSSDTKHSLARVECEIGNMASDEVAFQDSAKVYKELIELGTARGDAASVEMFAHESAQCLASQQNKTTRKSPK